jgi:PIN domain nuclease of toxin-antitoxin system
MLILDTHVLIWLDQDNSALGPEARKAADLALQQNRLAVSAITFWEVAMLVAKGRIEMSLGPNAWRHDLLRLGLLEIPVGGEIGIVAAELDLHGDPADRIIAATALNKDASLMTADQSLLQWHSALQRYDAGR